MEGVVIFVLVRRANLEWDAGAADTDCAQRTLRRSLRDDGVNHPRWRQLSDYLNGYLDKDRRSILQRLTRTSNHSLSLADPDILATMADYGWGLSEETEKKARRELNEFPERRKVSIESVREQMCTRPDINFLRIDDAFVLRFLRARKFNVWEAFRLYARYFDYRQNNRNLFKKFSASETDIKIALLDGFPGVLPQVDHHGRRILVLFSANWDNHRYGLASIYRAILLTLEKLIEDEETQVNGFVIIVDWSQFSFKQSTWINPKLLKLMIEGLQDCFPARFAAIHFVNQPWYVEAVFKVMKPFIKEKTRQKIHMHGNNMGTLHSFVHQDILSAELGGLAPPYHMQYWAKQLIGDETFSFGEKQIYWPDHCSGIKTRSETFPIDSYTTEVKTDERRGTQLDEEFFLID